MYRILILYVYEYQYARSEIRYSFNELLWILLFFDTKYRFYIYISNRIASIFPLLFSPCIAFSRTNNSLSVPLLLLSRQKNSQFILAFNQKHAVGIKDLRAVLTFHTDCVVGKETEGLSSGKRNRGIIGVKYHLFRNFLELRYLS